MLPMEVKTDLQKGDWLFGRGTMDMKAGLAAQMAVLSALADGDELQGNLLLVAVPDEERNSAGMLAAVPVLNQLKEIYGVTYEVCICSEPSFPAYPGDEDNYIYMGSVGKLLPLIFCMGKETHVGEPLEGLNAAWMASEIVNQIELSGKFADEVKGVKTALPTCLKLTDLKQQYNVQTPNMAYALYNILTMRQTPAEVMDKLKICAEDAADSIIRRLQASYSRSGMRNSGSKITLQPKVFTYHELYERGKSLYGAEFEDSIRTVIEEGRLQSEDERESTVKAAAEISQYFLHEAPFYLLLFAPPYYPHVYVDDISDREQLLHAVVSEVVERAKDLGEEIQIKTFFPALSDVCYSRIRDPQHIIPTLRENLPLFGERYTIPFDDILALDLPTINIGPHGKDAHKRTERLELNFSTKVTPQLLLQAIQSVLNK